MIAAGPLRERDVDPPPLLSPPTPAIAPPRSSSSLPISNARSPPDLPPA